MSFFVYLHSPEDRNVDIDKPCSTYVWAFMAFLSALVGRYDMGLNKNKWLGPAGEASSCPVVGVAQPISCSTNFPDFRDHQNTNYLLNATFNAAELWWHPLNMNVSQKIWKIQYCRKTENFPNWWNKQQNFGNNRSLLQTQFILHWDIQIMGCNYPSMP